MSLPALDFYCDETSHTASRFAAVSGILIPRERVKAVGEEVARLKRAHRKSSASEIGWSEINKRDRPLYEDTVSLFGSLIQANHVHFHTVICDFHEYDHRRFNKGDKHVGVSKTYYQLLLHRCCRLYNDRARIYVWPDKGECTAALPGFLGALRVDEAARFRPSKPTIVAINPIDSHSNDLMQLNDVILGAIGFGRNERHKQPDASPHKTKVAEMVLSASGLASFAVNTTADARRWTNWNWKPHRGRPQS